MAAQAGPPEIAWQDGPLAGLRFQYSIMLLDPQAPEFLRTAYDDHWALGRSRPAAR